jgi:hypothetical protein
MGNCTGCAENQRPDVVANTMQAYTLYGVSFCHCARCCSATTFSPGAPDSMDECCGCGTEEYNPPAQLASSLQPLEDSLNEAAEIASQRVSYCCHIWCSGCDTTATDGATLLNNGWCRRWDQELAKHNLYCRAFSEAIGMGRSRKTFLVLRVLRSQSAV